MFISRECAHSPSDHNQIKPEAYTTLARELHRVYREFWPYYESTLTADEESEIEEGYRQAWPGDNGAALGLYRAQVAAARAHELLGAWQDEPGSHLSDDEATLLCNFFGIRPGANSDMSVEQHIQLAQRNRDPELVVAELSVKPDDLALLGAWQSLTTGSVIVH